MRGHLSEHRRHNLLFAARRLCLRLGQSPKRQVRDHTDVADLVGGGGGERGHVRAEPSEGRLVDGGGVAAAAQTVSQEDLPCPHWAKLPAARLVPLSLPCRLDLPEVIAANQMRLDR